MSEIKMPYCVFCKYFHQETLYPKTWHSFTCDAFLGEIPSDIWDTRVDHRLPYEGDNGIQFELLTDPSELYIILLNPDFNPTVEDVKRLAGTYFYYAEFNQDNFGK